MTESSAEASFPPRPSPKEAQKRSINGCYSCYGHIYITEVVLDQVLAAPTAKNSLGVWASVYACACAALPAADTDSHSEGYGNGEQTALFLNTLFVLLLLTEFSRNVGA